MYRKRVKKKKKTGFTLTEIIVVLAILAVLIAIAVPSVTGYIKRADQAVDQANLKLLNDATIMYAALKQMPVEEVFLNIQTDNRRMQKLVDNGYLDAALETRQEDMCFSWESDENVWVLAEGDPNISGFISLLANSGIDLNAFLSKNGVFNIGSGTKYNPNTWNGYLEKLLEAGDVESNQRVSANEGSNTIGYVNPVSGKGTIIDFNNWNSIKNAYPSYLPPAIFITNSSNFDYNASTHTYIQDNLSTLKGTMVFYKSDTQSNSEAQVYYINEDGSLSNLYSIEEILGTM